MESVENEWKSKMGIRCVVKQAPNDGGLKSASERWDIPYSILTINLVMSELRVPFLLRNGGDFK